MKYLFALLLLCSSLCAADPANGPVFTVWQTVGHTIQWQLDRQAEGLAIESTIGMGQGWMRNSTSDLSDQISALDKQTFTVRLNNICDDWDLQDGTGLFPRVPLTADNWQQTHLCVLKADDGTLSYSRMSSPWETTDRWSQAGKLHATSPRMQYICAHAPNPKQVIWLENNESSPGAFGLLDFASLYATGRVYFINSAGTLRFLEEPWTSDPTAYCDGKGTPLPAWTVMRNTAQGEYTFWYWLPDATLDKTIDIRAKDWVAGQKAAGVMFPPDGKAAFDALYLAKYKNYHAAFNAAVPAGWQGKILTAGYQTRSRNQQNDGCSPPIYVGFYSPQYLSDPWYLNDLTWLRSQWDADEAAFPNSWREFSVTGTYKTNNLTVCNQGVPQTYYDPIDPDSWGSLCTAWAWCQQKPGRQVRQRYWTADATLPTQLVFASAQAQANCDAIGHPEWKTLTVADFELAMARRFAEVHNHQTLRSYWQQGTTQLLASPVNTAKSVTVWATETTLPASARTLLTVHNVKLGTAGSSMSVGAYSVPADARFAYYLTNPVEPLPAPTPEPPPAPVVMTLEELTGAVIDLQTRVKALESK